MGNESNPISQHHRDPIELRADLRRLDRRDWWRWAAASAIMLLTTTGVFVLSLPNLKRGWEEQQRLDLAVLGLFGMVLLFDVFSVFQQLEINRVRRQLANEMGVAAALQVLRRPAIEGREADVDERLTPRFAFDQRLTVRAVKNSETIAVYGRTCDISADGVGAIIPESIDCGAQVGLEMALDDYDEPSKIDAVVCHRRGFVHGFKFVNLTAEQTEAIRRACGDIPEAATFR